MIIESTSWTDQNAIPEGTLRNLVGTRIPLHHVDVPFVLLWAQKAGCTSLVSWYFWHAGVFEDARIYKPEQEGLSIHLYENQVFKSQTEYKKKLVKKIMGGAPLVNFVRCPYARAYSSFMHINNRNFLRLERQRIEHVGLKLRKRILRDVFGSQVGIEKSISFLEFLVWLNDQEMSHLDPHLRQQWTPLYRLSNVSHFRLEDFEFVSSMLERDYKLDNSKANGGLPAASHHLVKRKISKDRTLKLLAQGVPLERKAHHQFPEVNRKNVSDTKFGRLIEEIFALDLEFYDQIPEQQESAF